MSNRRYDGPYWTRTFKRSYNADILYNYNTPPRSPRQPSEPQPQSSQPKAQPSQPEAQPQPQLSQPQPFKTQPFKTQPFKTQPFKPQQSQPPPPFKTQPSETQQPQSKASQPKAQPSQPQPQESQLQVTQPSQPKPRPSYPCRQPSHPRRQRSYKNRRPSYPHPEPSYPQPSYPHAQPSYPQPSYTHPQPSYTDPQPSYTHPQSSYPIQLQPSQSSYFVPTQNYYDSYYNCNYKEFQYVQQGYQGNPYYENRPVPTFYLDVNREVPREGLVWIYPYNLEALLVPENYYNQSPIQRVPPEIFQDHHENLTSNLDSDRYLQFFPQDTEACLRIVNALLPLQIATIRMEGFFQLVKKPVILGNIKHRIIKGKYTRVVDVIHDLRAIVWNIDYYLSQITERLIREDNDVFSRVLEEQLARNYPGNNFSAITGDPDHAPE